MEPEISAEFTVTFHSDGHETIQALIPVLSRRAAQRCSVVERLQQE